MSETGYEQDICHFCHGPDAGYQRTEDGHPNGPFFDSCEQCLRKPDSVQKVNNEKSEFD